MFLLVEKLIDKKSLSPFELLQKDVEVETLLSIDEGNLWKRSTDGDVETQRIMFLSAAESMLQHLESKHQNNRLEGESQSIIPLWDQPWIWFWFWFQLEED